MPLKNVAGESAIFGSAGQHSDLVKRGTVGDESITGDGAVGGLDARDAAKGCWLPHRASGVGSQGKQRHACCNRNRRSAAATARHMLRIVRIARHAVGRVLGGGSHRKLIHVRDADDDCVLGEQTLHSSGVVGRVVALKNPGAAGVRQFRVRHTDAVLDGHRNACKPPHACTRCNALVNTRCSCQGCFSREQAAVGIELGFVFGDALVHRCHHRFSLKGSRADLLDKSTQRKVWNHRLRCSAPVRSAQ